MRGKVALAVILCATQMVACSSSSGNKDVPGIDSHTVDAIVGDVVSKVGPEGGLVEGPEGITLSIPAGALAEEVAITMTVVEPPALPEWLTIDGPVVEIQPSGVNFTEPALLTFPVPAGLDVVGTTFHVYTSQGDGYPWESVDTSVGTEVIEGHIWHLSLFGFGQGCVKEGKACNFGVDECCGSARCMDGQCKACGMHGGACETNYGCCHSLRCVDGTCDNCLARGETGCDGATDCCVGFWELSACVGHKCVACRNEGQSCYGDHQCCGLLDCVDNKCQSECGQLGQKCYVDNDCCITHDPILQGGCIGGVCSACMYVGESCSSTIDCCAGYNCVEGKCRDCKGDFQSCSAGDECCSLSCAEGKCVACSEADEACNANDNCCSGLCFDGHCVECKPDSAACDTNDNCCSELCFDGHCAQCKPDSAACESHDDCCSKLCDGGTCAACPTAGQVCTDDCCPGQCCDKGFLFCLEGTCSSCGFDGVACGSDEGCCGNLLCIEQKCSVCHEVDGSCVADHDCCEGGRCVAGQCEACLEDGTACTSGEDCCNTKCVMGECGPCLSQAEVCEKDSDCCSGVCNNGVCAACYIDGAACDDASKVCCEPYSCVEGTCQLACGWYGEACNDEEACCDPLFCVDGWCHKCGTEEEYCDEDIPCCDGYECLNGDCLKCYSIGDNCGEGWGDTPCCTGAHCVDGKCEPCVAFNQACGELPCCFPDYYTCVEGECKSCEKEGNACDQNTLCCQDLTCVDGFCAQGGGGGCKCSDPGTTLTPDPCDWEDATECSGWLSACEFSDNPPTADECNGTWPDGTKFCAFGCCLSIGCP